MAPPDAQRSPQGSPGRPHVDCMRCRAFFVTYDPELPYGCRTFGMRTRALPALVVRQSSGRDCEAFEPRPPRTRGS